MVIYDFYSASLVFWVAKDKGRLKWDFSGGAAAFDVLLQVTPWVCIRSVISRVTDRIATNR